MRRTLETLSKNVKKTGENLHNWFKLSDENGDKCIDILELKNLLKMAGVSFRDSDVGKIFEMIDFK